MCFPEIADVKWLDPLWKKKFKKFKTNGLLETSSLSPDTVLESIDKSIKRIDLKYFTNEFLLELNQYCKSIDIGQSGFVSILKNICPVETMSDASLANDDSIRLKVNRMKTNCSRLTTSKRKEEKQNFLGSLFEFPCIARTKAIDSEFRELLMKIKTNFLLL